MNEQQQQQLGTQCENCQTLYHPRHSALRATTLELNGAESRRASLEWFRSTGSLPNRSLRPAAHTTLDHHRVGIVHRGADLVEAVTKQDGNRAYGGRLVEDAVVEDPLDTRRL